MPNSCQELRDALAQCLQESDCVMIYRNKASDCLREPSRAGRHAEALPGNMPVTYRSVEASEQGKGYQLYAGKSAFGGSVKETDGNEPIPQDWREAENEKYRLEQQRLAQSGK
ncbi:hypothetical protein TrVFT333_008952 [Trichoderma virens FT-333]|nr:hypothetical protein TrVFT333_008952 [Trichoderma virens FT-333]